MWYFAYGSNMGRERLELHRAIKVLEVRQGVLENYRLVFNKISSVRPSTGCANIVPSEGDSVFGILYRIRDSDIETMDIFEGVSSDQYHRENILVRDEENSLVESEVYIADQVGENLEPSIEYLDSLVEGAVESGIDRRYIEETILVHYDRDVKPEEDEATDTRGRSDSPAT